MKLQIIGLGPGQFEDLTLKAYNLLKNNTKLILRTSKHPLVEEFGNNKIEFVSCDDFYEDANTFDEVYDSIVDFVMGNLKEFGEIQYAVPGSPLILEATVDKLIELANEEIEIELVPSLSALDAIYTSLRLTPTKGLITLDALNMPKSDFYIGKDILITQVFNKFIAGELKLALLEWYPPETEVTIIQSAGIEGHEKIKSISMAEMDWHEYDHLTSIHIPQVKRKQNYYELIKLVKDLRAPNGCPWDKEQTHETLQTALLEETYELLEAMQSKSVEGMCEELGDLLLQIAFHTVLAEEEGFFNYHDVINGIIEKMVRRHPHVFSDGQATTSREVLKSWEEIKLEEKDIENNSMMDNIPAILPALLQADKIQRKAARVGFDWDDIEQVWDKVYEELDELRDAREDQFLNELGDVLFAVVNLARFLQVDAESALISTIRKFKRRFRYIEENIAEQDKNFDDFTLDELDQLWNQAKQL